MAKTKHNYQNNSIYIIKCKDEMITDCYVGQTCDHYRRKATHKASCKKEVGRLYQFINSHGGWDNWTFEIIEKYPCENSSEARLRENYWINYHKANLNSHVSYDESVGNRSWFFIHRADIYNTLVATRTENKILRDEQQALSDKILEEKNAEYEKLKIQWIKELELKL